MTGAQPEALEEQAPEEMACFNWHGRPSWHEGGSLDGAHNDACRNACEF